MVGPKLYNIHLNDIPKFQKTQISLFADDTAIYSHSFNAIIVAKQVQIHMNLLEQFYRKWKTNLNANKTELIVFSKKTSCTKILQPIKVYGHTVEPVSSVKYLGTHLDSKLLFRKLIHAVGVKDPDDRSGFGHFFFF